MPAALSSMPLLWLSLAFLSGVLAGAALDGPVWRWLALAAGLGAGALLARRIFRRGIRVAGRAVPPGFLLGLTAVLCLGAARYRGAQPGMHPSFIAWYNGTGREMVVVGVVAAPPDVRDTTIQLRIEVERVRLADSLHHTAVEGLVLARLPPGETWAYGDRIAVRGALETPPSCLSSRR